MRARARCSGWGPSRAVRCSRRHTSAEASGSKSHRSGPFVTAPEVTAHVVHETGEAVRVGLARRGAERLGQRRQRVEVRARQPSQSIARALPPSPCSRSRGTSRAVTRARRPRARRRTRRARSGLPAAFNASITSNALRPPLRCQSPARNRSVHFSRDRIAIICSTFDARRRLGDVGTERDHPHLCGIDGRSWRSRPAAPIPTSRSRPCNARGADCSAALPSRIVRAGRSLNSGLVADHRRERDVGPERHRLVGPHVRQRQPSPDSRSRRSPRREPAFHLACVAVQPASDHGRAGTAGRTPCRAAASPTKGRPPSP